MKINKKEAILIVVVILVITIAAYYFYYLMPTLDDISNSRSAIEQKTIKSASMQAQIGQIGTVNQQIEDIKIEIEKKNENIPRGISEPIQLVSITNVFNDMGETLVVVFSTSNDSFETYQKNYVDINFSTNYENLLSILAQLEELPMENQVVSMDIINNQDMTDFYTQEIDEYYLSVGIVIEFYTFFEEDDQEPPEKQSFEVPGPVDGKNPFLP